MVELRQIRQLGLIGLIGGAFLSVYAIPDAFDPGTFSGEGTVAILYGAILIAILGLLFLGHIGLHLLHRDDYGLLGRVSFLIVSLGFVLSLTGFFVGYVLGQGNFDLFGITDGAFILAIASLLILILFGSMPLGYAVYRTGVLPRYGPLALIVSIPLGIIGLALLNAYGFVGLISPYGVGWIVLGYTIWSYSGPIS